MAVMMILMVVWMVAMGPHDGRAARGGGRPVAFAHGSGAAAMKTTALVIIAATAAAFAGAVLADAGHAHKSSGARAGDGHWTAPAEAARRANPVPADSFSRERGRALFEANCAGCHGPRGRGDGPAAARLETLPADLTAMARQHADGDFAWKIATGRGAMPAWKGILTENQIWDLVNFVQTLGDAPPHSHRY